MPLDLGRFRRDAIGPYSGQKFTIRKIYLRDCLLEIGVLPSVLLEPVNKQLEAFKEKLSNPEDAEAHGKIVKFYLSRGIVEPKVWFGEEKDRPEDAIAYEDLGGDQDYLVNQITEYSFDLRGLREFADFFRQSVAEPPGPDGAAVRAEAVEPDKQP